MEEVNKKKKSNRVVIVLNDEEYENFLKNKKIEGKTAQMLGYLALRKYNLINKPKSGK
jgi:hypothetical protein